MKIVFAFKPFDPRKINFPLFSFMIFLFSRYEAERIFLNKFFFTCFFSFWLRKIVSTN